MEKAKEQEVQELKDKLEASQGDVRINLKAKDDKINEVRIAEGTGGAWWEDGPRGGMSS